jgi:hypothetical protein
MRKSQKVRTPIFKGPPGPKGPKGDIVVIPEPLAEQLSLFNFAPEESPPPQED